MKKNEKIPTKVWTKKRIIDDSSGQTEFNLELLRKVTSKSFYREVHKRLDKDFYDIVSFLETWPEGKFRSIVFIYPDNFVWVAIWDGKAGVFLDLPLHVFLDISQPLLRTHDNSIIKQKRGANPPFKKGPTFI